MENQCCVTGRRLGRGVSVCMSESEGWGGGGARHFPKVIASTSKLEYLRYKTDICLHELMKEVGCIPKKKGLRRNCKYTEP